MAVRRPRGSWSTAAKVVSVLGCSLVRDLNTTDDKRLAHSANSYASVLHRTLGELGVKTTVYARVRDLSEFNSVMVKDKSMAGSKVTWPAVKGQGQPEYKAEGSKIQFAWEGDTQVRHFLYELQMDQLLYKTHPKFDDDWLQKAWESHKVGGAGVMERQII